MKVTDKRYQPLPYVNIEQADWIKNATLYQLNIRQFTPDGTFNAVLSHLPRLKDMRIDIIWLMPVNPIGKENRKGTLGSYYSVQDFRGINPEFGTEEEFKTLIHAIHAQGMHVILDWVAHHSSWDNPLVEQHPEWYMRNRDGNFLSTRWRDYDDIIDFDYQQPGLRKYMEETMVYWLEKYDIDGFRCDLASFIPLDFWENVREKLAEIKPVFMLAESQDRELHRNAFDATYAWTLWDTLREIANHEAPLSKLTEGYIAEHVSTFPKEGIRINFTDNHDKNSWEGNPSENFGEALEACMVLTTMMDGMPLVYNGQEAGNSRSLSFFEKDSLSWEKHPHEKLIHKLFELKHQNQSLWNGKWGGEMIRINNSNPETVLSFLREKNGDKTITIVNMSAEKVKVSLDTSLDRGEYQELFTGKKILPGPHFRMHLNPWQYSVLFRSSK